jgi:hypothetical protein
MISFIIIQANEMYPPPSALGSAPFEAKLSNRRRGHVGPRGRPRFPGNMSTSPITVGKEFPALNRLGHQNGRSVCKRTCTEENVSASNFTAMEASAEDNMQQLSEFDSSQIKTNGQIWRRGVVPAWIDLNGRNDASNLCDRIKEIGYMKLQLCRIREVLDHVHGAIARTDTISL